MEAATKREARVCAIVAVVNIAFPRDTRLARSKENLPGTFAMWLRRSRTTPGSLCVAALDAQKKAAAQLDMTLEGRGRRC